MTAVAEAEALLARIAATDSPTMGDVCALFQLRIRLEAETITAEYEAGTFLLNAATLELLG